MILDKVEDFKNSPKIMQVLLGAALFKELMPNIKDFRVKEVANAAGIAAGNIIINHGGEAEACPA